MRRPILIAIVVLTVIGLMIWFLWRPAQKTVATEPRTFSKSAGTVNNSPTSVPAVSSEYPQLSLKAMSRAEATKIYVQRLQSDPQADWKIPINFYGKVIDENNQPVVEASVKYRWTTIGVNGGSAEAQTLSDGSGLFSLTKQHGKLLEVHVEKEGYYPVEGGNFGGMAFEYANPSDDKYYEPDHTSPVLFHLHKKNLHADKLLHWQRDIPLGRNGKISVNLKNGQNVGGSASLDVEVLDNSTSTTWAIQVGVKGGGLQIQAEQFPFVAPTSGYQPTVTFNSSTPTPPAWSGDTFFKGGAIYVQTGEGYGRYEVRVPLQEHYVEIEGYFNPDKTSQNLEPAK